MSDGTLQPQLDRTNVFPSFRLRLWPAVLLLGLLGLFRLVASTGEFSPGKFFFGMIIAPVAVLVGMVLWTLLASGIQWRDRWMIVGTLAGMTVATILVSGGNFPVMALILYATPALVACWVGWLVITMKVAWPVRRAGLLLIFIAIGTFCSTLRLEGMDGEFVSTFHWRWTPTAEQQLLAELKSSSSTKDSASPTAPASDATLVAGAGDWVGFRGPRRDGRLTGLSVRTNWNATPPAEVWRHRIGPGWSSMTIVSDRLFTQEQRGDDEHVTCYDARDGKELWSHKDATRFNEPVAGPGPRATPTFHGGRLYTMGANGAVNCLDAATGKLIWMRSLVEDTAAKPPMWGFSSSPLVAQGIVIVFAGADEEKALVGYHADSGELAWTAGKGHLSYCSPQLCTLRGVDQLLICTDDGMASFEPKTGKSCWSHSWLAKDVARVVQPMQIDDRDVLIGTGMGVGTRRIRVNHTADDWSTEEIWTSRDIKPYYNDMVLSGDHLYGFDGNIFMCVSVEDGSRKWRARGYGNGQVLLLAEQSLLLILTEQGEVALVEAKPDRHEEIGRFKAIEGKTWNHPVVCRGKLYVRNGQEIACFDLGARDALKERKGTVDQSTEPPTK
jgi:outer membrane protein assembly factor BamB